MGIIPSKRRRTLILFIIVLITLYLLAASGPVKRNDEVDEINTVNGTLWWMNDYNQTNLTIRYHHYKSVGLEYLFKRPSAKPCTERAFMVLMINSKPSHFDRRNAIRRTWGNGAEINRKANHNYAWRTIFVVGLANDSKLDEIVEQESMQFGDMVLGDFIDNLQNLTEKSIMSMAWANQFCRPIYMYKGDDDVFVNTNNLFNYMYHQFTVGRTKRLWLGRVDGSILARRVVRKKGHKYFVSVADYPSKLFPRFCSGFAYVMSGDVIGIILKYVKTTKKLKTVDDAFIAILGRKAGLTPKHDARFHLFIEPKPKHRYTVPELRRRFAEHDITSEAKQKELYDLARRGTELLSSYVINRKRNHKK